MYRYDDFIERDENKIKRFIIENPFAVISVATEKGEVSTTQVPLLFNPDQSQLIGHIYKESEHYQALLKNKKVLILFHGPHAYVSAKNYENKRSASTWNYMSVQVKGKLTFLDHQGLLDALELLTDHFENPEDSPSSFNRIPPSYVNRLSRYIAAFQISLDDIQATFKLSQNQPKPSFDKIVNSLKNQGGMPELLSQEMQKIRSDLYK